MTMRFFEINEPENEVESDPKPDYATKDQQQPLVKQIEDLLKTDYPSVRVENRTDKIIPHIRIKNAFPKEGVKDKLVAGGLNLTLDKDTNQISTSDTFQSSTYSLIQDGVLFTIVLAGKGQEGKAQVGIQQLRPENFGLSNQTFNREQLASTVKSKISTLTKDVILQQGLIQLVDVALGKRSSVDQTLMDHMKGILNYISQDFGEVLAPLVLTKDNNELIKFPEKSNKPLIDVEISGVPMAVKSLSGSGNSFIVIKDLIDSYVDTKRRDDAAFSPGESYEILKDFVSSEGKTVDKLIRAAQKADIPEAKKLNEILKVSGPPMSYKELESAVARLVDELKTTGQENLYKRYLQTVLPAATAANRMTKPKEGRKAAKAFSPKLISVGLPADAKKYLNIESESEAEPNKRSAGKKKFDQNFVKAATRQLTYMLGVGFRNHVVDGPASAEMESTITDIMSAKNAFAAKIGINPNGSITIKKTPFKDLRFGYQYHAGTSTVDQNAPGFHIYFS
jgi:hypothetical protein